MESHVVDGLVPGRVLSFEGFLSTSSTMPGAETFAFARGTCGRRMEPIEFWIITNDGKDIAPYSMYQAEDEVLCLPHQRFLILHVRPPHQPSDEMLNRPSYTSVPHISGALEVLLLQL